jgi:mono/diheme cytochrome c family protein
MRFWWISAAALPLALAACASQPTQRELTQMSGGEMYESLCASCHGVSGEGDGPVAPLIKIHVPDLTRMAHREGGEFPAADIHRSIDGRFEHPAHGPRDMPVWGWQFYRSETTNDPAERARVDALIDRLVEYLRTIQKS